MTFFFLACGSVLAVDGKSSICSFSETSDCVRSLRFSNQLTPPEFALPHSHSPSSAIGFPFP